MPNKLKSIRTQIKTDALAYVGNYTWAGKVEIDRKSALSKDENLYANIRLGNFSPAQELMGGAANQWQRFADIEIEIAKGDGTLTDDEVLDAEADIEAIIKANQTWTGNAILTNWLGTEIRKEQEERTISMAIIRINILYQTTEWSTE